VSSLAAGLVLAVGGAACLGSDAPSAQSDLPCVEASPRPVSVEAAASALAGVGIETSQVGCYNASGGPIDLIARKVSITCLVHLQPPAGSGFQELVHYGKPHLIQGNVECFVYELSQLEHVRAALRAMAQHG
jgi:hypothetical protein